MVNGGESSVYEKNVSSQLPQSLSSLLEILSTTNDCQFIGRMHTPENKGCGQLGEFCEPMPCNHHHVLLYLPRCVNAEKLLKQTISQVLTNVTNAKVQILSVSYPENFLQTERVFSNNSLVVKGEKMQTLLNQKTTENLGCDFTSVWEFEKHNSLGDTPDNEKAWFVFQKLLELEKSEAPFKDTVIPYIDLLQRGFGRFFVAEHSRTLEVDLGVSNAQCRCFECMNEPLHILENSETQNSQLFSLFDENTIIDSPFL